MTTPDDPRWEPWTLLGAFCASRLRRPLPRTHLFGDGSACDGCDTAGVFTQRGGGWYCRRCWEEISALTEERWTR